MAAKFHCSLKTFIIISIFISKYVIFARKCLVLYKLTKLYESARCMHLGLMLYHWQYYEWVYHDN